MNAGAAEAWFIPGTIVAVVAGGAHVLLALVDTVGPTFFAPIQESAKAVMEGTGGRLVCMFGGTGARPSVWRVWLGVHIGFGLGMLTFGLLCLLIATHNFELVERVEAIRPLAVAFSAALLALSLRFFFFFYGRVIITAAATACFTAAMVLSA